MKEHWEEVYSQNPADQVSWFQEKAAASIAFIEKSGLPKDAAILDVGGGASLLADQLLETGYTNVSVLDISAAALQVTRSRLAERASKVRWIESDVAAADIAPGSIDLWHDRALFHFLTTPEERGAYVEALRRSVKPGGFLVIATFGPEGPKRCSGLPVVRYSESQLSEAIGSNFELLESRLEHHQTPFGTAQQFLFLLLRRKREGE